ncbi:VOC family protein [Streptomyces subrutilus]|uniref:VOC family protein n=1 Tax=Streptomyces subrutilus TaxID=36818 RepID=UPI002E110C9C|nr:VOC family protein [Streptomyces subrutilus]
MLSIGTIVMGAADVRRAADFWGAALDYVPRDPEGGGPANGPRDWTVLVPAHGPGPGLALGLSTSPVPRHPRVHLDLYAADAAEQRAEIDRLVALGARRVDWDSYPEDPDFVVLADPEGNPFCVIDTAHVRTPAP